MEKRITTDLSSPFRVGTKREELWKGVWAHAPEPRPRPGVVRAVTA
jgi:hypothetical protein